MARTVIKYDDYRVKAFLDANIILEGRPLTDLPWQEIDAEGPIIALMTPTAMNQVDSKKQDGRIGKRAREFNRLIGTVAAGGPPLLIRDSGPRVELALSRASRIPWDRLDDLDADDGDCRIVAEALHASGMNSEGKMLVSHDIKPIRLAADHDMATLHVSDDWLRAAEPSPHEKEVQKLKTKVAEYEAREPEFEIKVELPGGEPVPVTRVADLTSAERSQVERTIVSANPKQEQLRRQFGAISGFDSYDETYDDRYEKYRRRIPAYVANYEARIERAFNQAPVRIRVANVGKMQAENLLIEVRVSSGWIHDRYVLSSPAGPVVPRPREGRSPFVVPNVLRNIQTIAHRPGRHELAYKDEPKWASLFSVTCEDFRHGHDWCFEGVLGIDARAPDTKIIVSVTATNFRGKAVEVRTVDRHVTTVKITEVVDASSLKLTVGTPLGEVLRRKDYKDAIDWKAFVDADEDDLEDDEDEKED